MPTAELITVEAPPGSLEAAQGDSEAPAWLYAGEIPSLNGIRAVAVMLVMLAHAYQTPGFPNFAPLHWVARRGPIGVEIFFVLSGFLITTLLLRERHRYGGISIKGFYLRRILRIVPAYVTFLCVVALLQGLGAASVNKRDWAAALTYTVNFVHRPAWEIGHAWSLSIEEHFYLIWPFLLVILRPRAAMLAAIAVVCACFVARWLVLLLAPRYTPMAELWTFTRIDTIAVGCILAFMAWNSKLRQKLDALCVRRGAFIAFAICLVVSLAIPSAKWTVGIAYTLNAVFIALLLWCSVRTAEPSVSRFLGHWLLGAFGLLSYSLYLWQQLFLHPHQDIWACQFPQNACLSLLAAIGSYCLIERPFLALRHRQSDAAPVRVAGAPVACEP